MKTDLSSITDPRPMLANSLPGSPRSSRSSTTGVLLGVLVSGLLCLGCTVEETTSTSGDGTGESSTSSDSGMGHANDATPAGSQEVQLAEDSASNTPAASTIRGGRDTLDTGVDLSLIKTDDSGIQVPAPAYDPIADQNAAPGHLALVEGQEQVRDFGPLRQGEIGTHSFRLISDGEAPLVITRLKPSCGCTVAEIALLGAEGERKIYRTGSEIPPGTEFEIVAELNTTNKAGAVRTSVAIYSNDPRAVFSLNLKAEVQPVLLIEPSATMALGELSSVETARGTVRLSSGYLEPFLLTVDDRYIEGQPVKVDLTPIEPDAEGRSKEWDVVVEVGPNFPREGINNFPVVLNTDQEIVNPTTPNPDGTKTYHQTRIYALVTVLAMVGANPPFVSFGMLRPGEPLINTVRISSVDKEFTLPENPTVRVEGYRGVDFQFADNFSVEILPVEGENALDLEIKLTGMPEGFSGSFGGLVIVEVGHPAKEEVQVRFSGVCRAGLVRAPQKEASQPVEEGDHDGHDH